MTAHELARALLEIPDLPIYVYCDETGHWHLFDTGCLEVASSQIDINVG